MQIEIRIIEPFKKVGNGTQDYSYLITLTAIDI